MNFNAFAEWKVDIINKEGQNLSKDGFASKSEAEAYVETNKKAWGLDKRWTPVFCENNEGFRVVEEYGVNITQYDCPATYSVSYSDITTQRQQEALAAALDINIKCGADVKKFITLRNLAKGIEANQVTEILDKYRIINELLDSGSLPTAEGVINNEPVTALMTQEDKDAILAKIASCKAN